MKVDAELSKKNTPMTDRLQGARAKRESVENSKKCDLRENGGADEKNARVKKVVGRLRPTGGGVEFPGPFQREAKTTIITFWRPNGAF